MLNFFPSVRIKYVLPHKNTRSTIGYVGSHSTNWMCFQSCGRRIFFLFSLNQTFSTLPSAISVMLHRHHTEPPHDKTNKMACAPSEDSDQPGHPPSLIRVVAVRMKKAWVLSYTLSTQRRLWSNCRWAHMPFCWFCHEAAHTHERMWLWWYACVLGGFWYTFSTRK